MRKIAEITQETGIVWRHCPTDKNLAVLGSCGASIDKMQTGQWLKNKEEWLVQPKLERTQSESEEHKAETQEVLYSEEKEPDQWEALLDRSTLKRNFRVTERTLRFVHNSLFKRRNTKKRSGPLTTKEINNARNQWIRKAQTVVKTTLENPGWNWGQKKVPMSRSVMVEFLVTKRCTLQGESSPTSLHAMSTKT